MPAVFLEPRLHPSIVKFFALIRLHAELPPRRGLAANSFQSSYHVLAAFGFDGDGPGILGQDIDHGQQIFVPLIPSTEFLHVHQINLPLFVSVKGQRGSGRETRPSGFVERITDTDTRSFPFSFFNSFVTHLHDFFFQNKVMLPKFLCKWSLLSLSLSWASADSAN